MTKAEAESAIRKLVVDWANETGVTKGQAEQPSFGAFQHWLSEKGYAGYLDFRSTAGALYDAEMWFDQELGQAWRN